MTAGKNKAGFLLMCIMVIMAGAAVAVWYRPHTKVENVSGVSVTAGALSTAYAKNEQSANAQYLNKAIQVSGTIIETDKNQDGGTMIVLGTGDPMNGIQCTLRDKTAAPEQGRNITLKGFCTGANLTGVTLTDCIVVH